MRLAKGYLFLLGLVTFGFGVIYLAAPSLLTDPTGFGDLAPEAVTDVRATYGGLQLALGIFFMWTSRKPAFHRIALMLSVIVFACLAGSRTIGLLVDREPTFPMVGSAIAEAAWAAVSWVVLSKQQA